MIGACHTAALVSKPASIDWLCFRHFDSAACFATRLGTAEHGRFLDLAAMALLDSPDLAKFAGRMSDSGRWTITAAINESVPAPVLSAALYEHFSSRGEGDFADKVLSASSLPVRRP
jgi:6-phosphogluconate dehydrogenase (decarboxylating)